MAQEVFHHTFENGLTLLMERMDHVRSATMNFLVPAGCVYDPPRQLGTGALLAEIITRGAGDRDSRELTLTLDGLGLDRDESVGAAHMRFWGATLARNLPAALEVYADILRRPRLPADELDAVKALAIQDIHGLEDEPAQKAFLELRRRHFPQPLGRDWRGTPEGIARVTIDDLRRHHARQFQPQGTILSVAGNVEWGPLREQVARLFGDWAPNPPPAPQYKEPLGGRKHLTKDTTQTQIAVAFPSVPFGHREYYAAQGAVMVLSGGMGARLFTEVREKRGLCYSVSASYQTFKEVACVLSYAGTTNERAQETLDVLLGELVRLQEGVEKEEVDRVRTGLKSSLIMQQESTSARAMSLASDWYYLRRVRPLDEIQAAVESLTPRKILEHVRRYPARDFTIVTLGPKPLKVRREFSARVAGAAG